MSVDERASTTEWYRPLGDAEMSGFHWLTVLGAVVFGKEASFELEEFGRHAPDSAPAEGRRLARSPVVKRIWSAVHRHRLA
jgi:hypothetical protein